jgi:glycosyltransferase involved in cell wall biosynthesis
MQYTWMDRLKKRNRSGERGSVAGCQRDRISVVIPLYNHARFIGEAVDSVLAQGFIVRELIVVDDGSHDESAAIMREISQRDPRIVFWSQPNRGAHAAINSGLWRATADLLAILNSDDVYAPARLTSLANALDADPSADIAASGISFIDTAGQPISNPWYDDALRYFKQCGDISLALINGNFLMTTSNFVFRRRLLDEIGYFAPLRYAHDLDFALRVVASRKRFVLAEESLLAYRTHDGNTISRNHAEVRVEWAIVTAAFLAASWHRGPVDWGYARALEGILERHKLTLPVHLSMIYSGHHSGDTLERSPLLLNPAFRAFLIESIQSRSYS